MEKINSTKQCPFVWIFRVDIFLEGFLIDHNLPAGAAGFFALAGDAVKFFIIIRDAVLHVCSFGVGIMIFPAVTVFANIITIWSIAWAGRKSNDYTIVTFVEKYRNV